MMKEDGEKFFTGLAEVQGGLEADERDGFVISGNRSELPSLGTTPEPVSLSVSTHW
ncbi:MULTISPECIES: hypothetical protein [Pseudomonas]|jgi:hypothetical protein|uniref:hypothetical protein n=1 Tax=Pseudomonas TaxID=286 RepID=UPI00193ECEBF|nr:MULTISPECIES: hypothetical protein [Pseudomonas]